MVSEQEQLEAHNEELRQQAEHERELTAEEQKEYDEERLEKEHRRIDERIGRELMEWVPHEIEFFRPTKYPASAIHALEKFTDVEIEKSGGNWTVALPENGFRRSVSTKLTLAICESIICYLDARDGCDNEEAS